MDEVFTVKPDAPRQGKRHFTLAEARRALPLVQRIAADIHTAQQAMQRLELELGDGVGSTRKGVIEKELERNGDRVDALVVELERVGVTLKTGGMIDFPAMHEGREIWLCWQPGEETIGHWHELSSGAAGRRDASELEHPQKG